MPTVHADVAIMSCWRHPYPGQPRGSGQLVFGSGQPIRAKKTRVASHLAGACGYFQRSISTQFSPVASSLPPIQIGMVKTQF
jgi:hypothetical protein